MRAKLLAMAVGLLAVGCDRPATPTTATPNTQVNPLTAAGVPLLPAEEGDYDEAGNYRDPARSLKTAVASVYSAQCGADFVSKEHKRCEAVMSAATEQELMAALTAVAADRDTQPQVFGAVASNASRRPFSAEFLEAVRQNRNTHKRFANSLPSVCEYFEKHGDKSDLTWMEAALNQMGERNRNYVEASAKKLRKRLAAEGQ